MFAYLIATSLVAAGRLTVPGHGLSLSGSLVACLFITSGFLAGAFFILPQPADDAARAGHEKLSVWSMACYATGFAFLSLAMPAGPSVTDNCFEALAHVWVGLTAASVAFFRGWRRWAALALLIGLSAFEAWMFFHRKGA
jgi:hypothetical protein